MSGFELGEAFVRVRPNMDRFEGEAKTGIGGALSNVFSGSAVMGSLNTLGGAINKTIIGAVAAAGAAGAGILGMSLSGGLTRLLDTEDARKMFGQLGLGVDEVDGLLGQLDETFLKGSFAYPDVYNVSSQLMASGTAMDDLNDRTLTAGNMAAFAGVELDRVGEILSIISANGKVSAAELNRIGQMGIPIKSILADAFDVTQEELMEMVSAGELTTDMFFEAAGGASELDGAMEGMADTTRGAWANFKTAFAGVGEALLAPWFGENGTMVGFLQTLGDYIYANMGSFQDWGERIYEVGMNAIQNTIIPALQTLMGIIRDHIVPALQAAGEWYRNNEEMIKRVAAAVGPAIGIVAALASSIHLVRTAFMLLIRATPLGMVLALVTGLVYAWQNSETFRDIVTRAFEVVRGVIETVVNFVVGLFETVVGWFQNIGSSSEDTGSWIGETWGKVMDIFGQVGEIVGIFVDHFMESFETLREIISAFFEWSAPFWEAMWEFFKINLQFAWDIIKSIITLALDVIQGALDIFLGIITGDWDRAWQGVQRIFQGVWNHIERIFQAVLSKIRSMLSVNLDGIRNMWRSAWDWVRNTVSNILNSIRNTISNIINGIRSRITSVFNAIRNLIGNAVNGARSRVTAAFNGIRNAVRTAINFVLNLVRNLPRNILKALGNMGKLLINAGKALIRGFTNGIRNMISAPVDAVRGMVSRVRNLLPFSPAKEGPFSGSGYPLFSGEAIGEDLARGIDRARGTAKRAAEKLMGDVSGAMGTSTPGVAVAGAGRAGHGGSGDVYTIEKVEIAAKDIQEMQDVADFFSKVRQTARAGAGRDVGGRA